MGIPMVNRLEFDGSTMNLIGFPSVNDNDILYYVDLKSPKKLTIFAKDVTFYQKHDIDSSEVKSVEVQDRMILDPDFISRFSPRKEASLTFRYNPSSNVYICQLK